MACTGACSSRQGSGGEQQRQEKHYELKRRGSVFGMPAPRVWPPPYSPHLSAMGSPEDSWEVRAFAEDMATCSEQWPPRSYSCSFCGREFRTAQALGGHMNVHRRERAYANQIGLLKSNSNSSDNTSPPQSGLSPASHQPAPSLGLCLLYPNAQNTPSDSPYKYHPNPPLSSPQCSRSKNSSDSSLSESGFLPESLYPVDSSNKPPYRHPAWDALELHDDTLDLELRLGHAP